MVKTLSRSAVLARELLAAIARRELQPGDPIDIQALGRQHGVSRTVVREALADLGGKGLVVARPKVGTTVAPASQWNLLDPVLVAVAIAEQDGPGSILDEALALRSVIEPALAADAARDASRAQRARILGAVRTLAGAVGAGDRDAQAQAEATLHEAIVDACANRLLRSADRALEPVRALCRTRTLAQPAPRGDTPPDAVRALVVRTALAVAIARGDATAAGALALTLSRVGCLPQAEPAPAAVPASVPAAVPVAAPPARPGAGASVRVAPARSDAGSPPTAVVSANGPLRRAVPAGGAAYAVLPALAGDAACSDWPETAMLIHRADPIRPLRRGRLDPDTPATPDGSDDSRMPRAVPVRVPARDPVDS